MTVVVDHDNNRVIWAGEGVGMAALQPFFDQMGPERCAAVELVSRDGAAWIEAACRENLPNATQVMDPFHALWKRFHKAWKRHREHWPPGTSRHIHAEDYPKTSFSLACHFYTYTIRNLPSGLVKILLCGNIVLP